MLAFAPQALQVHRGDSDERLVGPGLLSIGERAVGRVPGLTAADYLRQSIIDPSAYVVEGYGDLMPKNFSRAFTTKYSAKAPSFSCGDEALPPLKTECLFR